MREWEKKFPGRIESIFGALTRVVPSHLMDSERFDFKGLTVKNFGDAAASGQGDIGFDVNPEFEATALATDSVLTLSSTPIQFLQKNKSELADVKSVSA